MATTKITDLTAYTDPVSTDVVPIVDVTSDVTKKVSIADLMENAGSGTEALPGISFDGDPNTGIYRPGADQVAISTGGTGRLFIDASGNVGIGTTSPNNYANYNTLTLNDTTGAEIDFESNGTNTLSIWSNASSNYIHGRTATPLIFLTNNTPRLYITSTGEFEFTGAGTAGTTQAVYFSGSAPVNSLVVDSSGNVGLKTTSPSARLHIANSSAGVNGVFIDAHLNGTGEGLQIYANTRTSADDATALLRVIDRTNSDAFRVNVNGRVGIGTSSPNNKFTIYEAAANPIRLIQDHATSSAYGIEFYSQASTPYTVSSITASHGAAYVNPYLNFNVADTSRVLHTRMAIDSSGNVGIGTTSPSSYNANGDNLVVYDAGNSGITVATGSSTGFGTIYFADGTAGSAPYSGFLQYYHSVDTLYIGSGAATTITCDSGQRVGINNTSPANYFNEADNLVVGSSGSNGITIVSGSIDYGRLNFADGTGANAYRGYLAYSHNSDLMTIGTAGQPAVNIDSSQRVLVGTSSTSLTSKLNVKARSDDSNGNAALSLIRGSAASAADQMLGAVQFLDANENYGATIYSQSEAAWTSGSSHPARLVFGTTASGASSPTERMRIDSVGNVTFTNGTDHSFNSANGNHCFLRINADNATGSNAYLYLTCPGQNAGGMYYERSTSRLYAWSQNITSTGVYLSANATAWTAVSDERQKDIIEPIENAVNKVSSLRAVIGKYKTDKNETRRSFLIAQDVQEVLPEAVSAEDPECLGLAYTAVIPLLVAAIKEQQSTITDLQTRLAALEAN